MQNRPEITAQGVTFDEKLRWLEAFAQSDNRYIIEVNANVLKILLVLCIQEKAT